MRYLITIIFVLWASSALADKCTMTASGNWNDNSKWGAPCNGSGVPGEGAFANYSAVIPKTYAATVTDSRTLPATIIGSHSNTAGSASLTISDGLTITQAGNITIDPDTNSTSTNLTSLTIGAGVTWNMQNYWWKAIAGGNSTGSNWAVNINGTSGSPTTITGTAGSRFDLEEFGVGSYSQGSINWNYVDISGVSGASNQPNNVSGMIGGFIFNRVRAKNTGALQVATARSQAATAKFELTNNSLVDMVIKTGTAISGAGLVISSLAAPTGAGTRIFTGNTMYQTSSAINFNFPTYGTITNNILLNVQAVSANPTMEYNAFYTNTGNFAISLTPAVNVNTTMQYSIIAGRNNAHGMTGTATGTSVITSQYNYYEGTDGGDDNMNLVGTAVIDGTNSGQLIWRNNLSTGGGNFLNPTGRPGNVLAYNNTVAMDNGTSTHYGFFYTPETYPVSTPNEVSKVVFRDNLIVDTRAAAGTNSGAITQRFNASYLTNDVISSDYNAFVPLLNRTTGTFLPYDFTQLPSVSVAETKTGTVTAYLNQNHKLATGDTYEIQATATGTYQWRKNGGSWTTGATASTTPALLSATDNVYVWFSAATGMVAGDDWLGTYTMDTIATSKSGYTVNVHDIIVPSSTTLFFDKTRLLATYTDDNLGVARGTNTVEKWFEQAICRNGWDKTGSPVTFNSAFNITDSLNWVNAGWVPTAEVLLTSSSTGGVIGAFIPQVIKGNAFWFGF